MGKYIGARITAKGFARLLIMDEIDLGVNLSQYESVAVMKRIITFSVEELLSYVDAAILLKALDSTEIPQFGRIETVYRVPDVFEQEGILQADYAQLGFYLKKDPNSNLGANTKYGENHGKVASQLGIIDLVDCKFQPSALTCGYISLNAEERKSAIAKLCFRIPVIQELLRVSNNSRFDGKELLSGLSESVQERRASSIRTLLRCMSDLDNAELNRRINNIWWSKGDS